MGANPKTPSGDLASSCPCCASQAPHHLLTTAPLPVNSCILTRSERTSLSIEKRSIELWYCPDCDFLWNRSFEPDLVTYDESYEGTQIYSGYFRSYISDLAERWLSQLPRIPGNILEVGCGQGEFLEVLSKVIPAPLAGYDPAYRGDAEDFANIHRQELPSYPTELFDLVLNRMTLEHISAPLEFLSKQAKWLSSTGTLITQVPNSCRMVEEQLPCDLIYEHVNYFTAKSLKALHRRIGFTEVTTQTSYGGQHLDSLAGFNHLHTSETDQTEPETADSDVNGFRTALDQFSANWDRNFEKIGERNGEVWLWGAGSRATTFLGLLSRRDLVQGVIDINPKREGTYVLGTTRKTFRPERLSGRKNLSVIIANPIYLSEITKNLNALNVTATMYNLNGESIWPM